MLQTILGDTLVHDGTGATPYYSPPFGRGGEAAVFTLEVTHRSGSPSLVFAVEHKNAEDANWSGVGLTTTSAASSPPEE